MQSNFKVLNGGVASDLGDLFLPRSLFSQGGLWSAGANAQGQLGDNTTVAKSSLVQVSSGGLNWKQVAGGYLHGAGIKTDGTLWTWGYQSQGQLGNNANFSNAITSPIQTVAGGTNWKLAACGHYHMAAIKTDGTLWLWGNNGDGQLGDNTATSRSSPVQTVAAGSNWKLVSCNYYITAAIKTDGTLWTWGYNLFGQLGDNTTNNKGSPAQTIAAGTNWKLVSCGEYHMAAIKTDGTLWSWGLGTSGQMGDNTTGNKSSPVQTVAAGTNWKAVACGRAHTAAIKTNGTLWTWGYNAQGQLGDNVGTPRSSPIQTISAGTNWKSVSCGLYHTAALKTDGTLWGWGRNSSGQLGDNTLNDKSSPVQTVTAGTNWKFVTCGFYHTAAITDIY